ncbi:MULTISPECIES: hypothetical protein [Actinosynnema]|uniref:MmpS family membrane protein n=1 Tax=Actinosynnema pretiosum TaxID=42197 RepID=A0A290ZEJ8_9PSEU|nr:hypothetical protein [Actinosynnema pretiosum]ATE57470.1 hypothetical protein CNX65_32615 [Actinosynnema pretiosum]
MGSAREVERSRRWLVVSAASLLLLGALVGAVLVNGPSAPRSATVVYEVTGEAGHATVVYSTFDDGGVSTGQEELSSLPWRREVTAPGDARGVLTVTIGEQGGEVGCQVSVDGVERRSASASGPGSSAFCGGF